MLSSLLILYLLRWRILTLDVRIIRGVLYLFPFVRLPYPLTILLSVSARMPSFTAMHLSWIYPAVFTQLNPPQPHLLSMPP